VSLDLQDCSRMLLHDWAELLASADAADTLVTFVVNLQGELLCSSAAEPVLIPDPTDPANPDPASRVAVLASDADDPFISRAARLITQERGDWADIYARYLAGGASDVTADDPHMAVSVGVVESVGGLALFCVGVSSKQSFQSRLLHSGSFAWLVLSLLLQFALVIALAYGAADRLHRRQTERRRDALLKLRALSQARTRALASQQVRFRRLPSVSVSVAVVSSILLVFPL
jgi:hypothetical protein